MSQRQFSISDSSVWNDRYGDGSDGAHSPSTASDGQPNVPATGTSGTSTLTVSTGVSFFDGNPVLIHQTQGSGVGNWELNKIASGGGTTSFTMTYPLTNTYSTGAQVYKLNQYTSVNIAGGVTITGSSWNGSTGGIYGFLCNGTATITGTINGGGSTGGIVGPVANGTSAVTIGGGFRGGYGMASNGSSQIAQAGEGYGGANVVQETANTSGGGGGNNHNLGASGGGGGGHAAAGSTSGGTGGAIATDNAGLTVMQLGGGGGGGTRYSSSNNAVGGAGGSGGAIIFIISKTLVVTGAITSNGGTGGGVSIDGGGGGGGAGGSILLKAQAATLGTNAVTATGGAGGTGNVNGGAGANGRIHLDYAISLTGTTNPTINSTLDSQLADPSPNSVKANIKVSTPQDSSVKANILVLGGLSTVGPSVSGTPLGLLLAVMSEAGAAGTAGTPVGVLMGVTGSTGGGAIIGTGAGAFSTSVKANLILVRGIKDNYVTANMQSPNYEKKYDYRIYNSTTGAYISSWSKEVLSQPTFRTVINGGPGEMVVSLDRSFDDFGEGDDVTLGNRVEVWCADRDNPSGIMIYAGEISGYRPILDGHSEYIEVTILHNVAQFSQVILRNSDGSTEVPELTEDPSDIFRDILSKYQADGGKIRYTGSSIDNTSSNVSYTFSTYSVKDAVDKAIELTPDNWYWRVDPDDVFHLHTSNFASADHTFYIGKHINHMETWRRGEDIANRVYFVGGGTPKLYRVYSASGSIASYGIRAVTYVDSRVELSATADIIANRILSQKQDPEIRTQLTILDNNGLNSYKGYDIESVKVGQTMRIFGLKATSKTTSLWDVFEWDTDVWDQTIAASATDVLQIQSVSYAPGYITIEASSRVPVISKRIEDVNRNLVQSQTTDTPVTPTEG